MNGHEFLLQADQLAWIDEMRERYDIVDRHKALRIILRYVMEEGDPERVFTQIRCTNC